MSAAEIAIAVFVLLDLGLVLWVRHYDRRPARPVHHQGARRLPQ